MNTSIFSIISDPDTLLELEPEELAGYVMEYLLTYCQDAVSRQQIEPSLFTYALEDSDWPTQYHDQISQYHPKITKAIMEAWVWLEREGFVARYTVSPAFISLPGVDYVFKMLLMWRRFTKPTFCPRTCFIR